MARATADRPHGVSPKLAAIAGVLLTAALIAVFIGLRATYLEADPPRNVGGEEARELFAEPPAKAYEARNWVLFDVFDLSSGDGDPSGAALQPAWVYPLAGFFRAFGVDYPQLRIFSTLYAALGFAFVLAIARRVAPTAGFAFAGLVLAFDAVYFQTARVGFVEPAASSWLAIVVFALLAAERDRRWLLAAHLAFVIALFTRQAAFFALPLVAGATAYRLRGSGPSPTRRTVIASAIALVALAALYLAVSGAGRDALRELSQLVLGSDTPTRHVFKRWWSTRLRDPARFSDFFASVPVTGPIAIATLACFAVQGVRKRRWPSYRELLVFAWFASALIAMLLFAKSALRYWTFVVPPAALVAAIGLTRGGAWLREHGFDEDAQRGIVLLPLMAALLWAGLGHLRYMIKPEYTIRDGAHRLEEAIGAREATIVGFASPGVVFGTGYRNFYVRGTFKQPREELLELRITHFLFRDGYDGTRNTIERVFPTLMPTLEPRLKFQVRGEELSLYDVQRRLPRPALPY